MEWISIRGARQHNLKDVSVDLPRSRLVVITGVSGSGKSSLAFDTLFAEGQRRYMESLSTYARQFLRKLDAPRVEAIEGLSPAIAIEQRGMSANPRSTVGTLTEIHDYLRLLFARLGAVYCPACGKPVRSHTIAQMVQEVSEWPDGSRLLILAPLGMVEEKALPKLIARLRRDGFVRVRLNGKIHEIDPPTALPRHPSYRVEVVVDRLILSGDKPRRLADALELASKMGQGRTMAVRMDGESGDKPVKSFSESFACEECGRKMIEPSPGLFSFHHPSGACPACNGLGYVEGSTGDEPGEAAPGREKGRAEADTEDGNGGEPEESQSLCDWSACPQCGGARINEEARSVRLGSLGIHQVCRLAVADLREWLLSLDLPPDRAEIAERPTREVLHRLKLLDELGLSYLCQDRPARTLSGGEAQRIRLANQIGAPMSGVLYVLDEPSIGLHPRDHGRLLDVLFRLRDSGNSVVVVEHDARTILEADYVVDMGPGAGELGGEVTFAGAPDELLKDPSSLTGLYLSGRRSIPVPARRPPFQQGSIRLKGATGHNLKGVDVDFPLGCMVCVTGVSGSGKSTLVLDTLYRILARKLYNAGAEPAPFESVEGTEAVQRVIHVDQSPLGRNPRSNPATHTGIFALIREIFARVPEARARGYGAARFSFNVKGGRCESCRGEGVRKVDMAFLPDVHVTCPVCGGSRYNRETLDILFKGESISDVLDMTVHEAAGLFENLPAIRERLEVLGEVGLGYLRLGQPATMLSGGEAQRVKLARELGRRSRAKTLYILDEPTTGLHFEDILKLLHVLQRLVNIGHTVVLIEHHPDVIKTTDYVIDLGPEGGEMGGTVTARGTPEEVSRVAASHTGAYLRDVLAAAPSPSV